MGKNGGIPYMQRQEFIVGLIETLVDLKCNKQLLQLIQLLNFTVQII